MCLTPLLRVGIMAPPPARRSPIMRALRAEVWGSAPYGVEMACALIELGADTTVASLLRKAAKARIALAQRILNLHEVPIPVRPPHLWLPTSPVRPEKLARRAREHGVPPTPPPSSFL